MLQVQHIQHDDGSITIKIGRTKTVLRSGGEADAFMAGARVAQMTLAKRLGKLLTVTSGDLSADRVRAFLEQPPHAKDAADG